MIFDKQNMFSDKQTVSTTAVGQNTIDLGPGKINGSHVRCVVFLEEGATLSAGQLSIAFWTGDTTGGGTGGINNPVPVGSFVLSVNDVAAGGKVVDCCLPAKVGRYLAVQYTAGGGTLSGCKITAGLVLDSDAR